MTDSPLTLFAQPCVDTREDRMYLVPRVLIIRTANSCGFVLSHPNSIRCGKRIYFYILLTRKINSWVQESPS